MPQVTEAPVKAYAHCIDPLCPGYHQEEIDAQRVETGWTVGENGGDGAFAMLIERSVVDYRFENEADRTCPVCAKDRNVTGEPRKQYQALSGHDPMYLATSKPGAFPAQQFQGEDPRDAKIAGLEAKLNTLIDALEGGS